MAATVSTIPRPFPMRPLPGQQLLPARWLFPLCEYLPLVVRQPGCFRGGWQQFLEKWTAVGLF